MSLHTYSSPNFITLSTGWHISLIQTSRWHQNKSSVLAWPGMPCPGQNRTFVLMSKGGLNQRDVSPCRLNIMNNIEPTSLISQSSLSSLPPATCSRDKDVDGGCGWGAASVGLAYGANPLAYECEDCGKNFGSRKNTTALTTHSTWKWRWSPSLS